MASLFVFLLANIQTNGEYVLISTIEGVCDWCFEPGQVTNFSEHNPHSFICAECEQRFEDSWEGVPKGPLDDEDA